MEFRIAESVITLKEGDITRETTDALVNAANSTLRGGGGVDGAIHRAGGPRILEECIAIGACAPGEAVITSGGNLEARYVIHTVGPIWQGGNRDEERLLSRCYQQSLQKAIETGVKTLSFPSISTGAYGYPLDLAAPLALKTIATYLETHSGIEKVQMVLFDSLTFSAYQSALKNLMKERNE